MKKFLSALLAILTCFTLVSIVPVKAEVNEQILKSFEIVDFNDSFATTDSFVVDFEWADEKYADSQIALVFRQKENNNQYVQFWIDGSTFAVQEKYKYLSKNYEFLFLQLYYYEYLDDGDIISHDQYYSPYSYEELMSFNNGYYINENTLYTFDKDYSFSLSDSNPEEFDFIAPTVNNMVLSQDKNKISVEFETNETELSGFQLGFSYNDNGNIEMLYPIEYSIINGICTATFLITNNIYNTYEEGTYPIGYLELRDKVDNSTYLYSSDLYNYSIVINNEHNVTEAYKQRISNIDFTDFIREIESGTLIPLTFLVSDLEYSNSEIVAYYKRDDGVITGLYVNDYAYGQGTHSAEMQVHSDLKYHSQNYEFVCLNFKYYGYNDFGEWGEIGDEYHTSKYTKEELTEMFGGLSELSGVYQDCEDYSFTLTDCNPNLIDNTAPSIENLSITQNGSMLHFEFESDENGLGIEQLELDYVGENSSNFTLYIFDYQLEKNGDTYTGDYELTDEYIRTTYGNYKLSSARLYDKGTNCTTKRGSAFDSNSDVSLVIDDNELEFIKDEDINIFTDYEDGEMYMRLGGEVGSTYTLCTYIYESGYEYWLGNGTLDLSGVNFNVAGVYKIPVTVEFKVNSTTSKTFTKEVTLNVVEVIGMIIENDLTTEVSMTYDEYLEKSNNIFKKVSPKVTIQLDDGTYIRETLKPAIACKDISTDALGALTYEEYVLTNYNPKYMKQSELISTFTTGGGMMDPETYFEYWAAQPGMILMKTIYHITDEYGNLVDLNGDVVVKFEDRVETSYKKAENSADEVNISSLYGTLPTYTEISAEEVDDLSDLNGEDYIAYDINLIADYENIQPVGTTNLAIDLPEELADGESYVAYHYDDLGNKEEVEVTVENGKAYIKAESFSTYAIVKKSTTTPGGNEGNAGGNAGNGESAPGSGDNTNNNSGSNNNTTGSGTNNSSTNSNTTTSPNTGDSTNVAMLLALLLSSAYVLGRKRA